MPYIQRELQPQILSETPPKAIVIFGARQIGKTTLLTELAKSESSVRWFNGIRLKPNNNSDSTPPPMSNSRFVRPMSLLSMKRSASKILD